MIFFSSLSDITQQPMCQNQALGSNPALSHSGTPKLAKILEQPPSNCYSETLVGDLESEIGLNQIYIIYQQFEFFLNLFNYIFI